MAADWRSFGEVAAVAPAAVVATCRTIARVVYDSVTKHCGCIVRRCGVGSSVTVFPSTALAVSCACEIQAALMQAEWPAELELLTDTVTVSVGSEVVLCGPRLSIGIES